MSQIEFQRVCLKNYGSYKDLTLDFKPGFHLISGSNGFGKSTPFIAIVECLLGIVVRDKDPSHQHKGDCSVSVEFVKDEKLYKVVRYWKPKSKPDSNPELFCNGELISDRKKLSTQSEINSLLSMSPDLFTSVVVVLQGLPTNFSIMTPTARKVHVEEMVGFEVWDVFRKQIQGKLGEVQSEFHSQNAEHARVTQEMKSLYQHYQSLKTSSSSVQNDFLEIATETKRQLNELKNEYFQVKQRLSDIDKSVLDSQYQQYEVCEKARSQILSQIETFKAVVDNKSCPTCLREYPKEKIEQAEKKLSMLSEKFDLVSSEKAELEKALFTFQQDKQSLQSLDSQKQAKLREIQSIQQKLENQEESHDFSEMESQLTDLRSQTETLSESVSMLKEQVDDLEYCSQQLMPSSKFRAFVLKKYLDHLNGMVARVLPILFEGLTCELILSSNEKGLDFEIKHSGKTRSYKSLSGGEKRRLDVAFLFAFQKFLIESSEVNTNLLVLDEIFDGLDSEGVVRTLECVEYLFPKETCTYVISHNTTLKTQFNSVLRVEKHEGVSTLLT